MLSRTQTHLAAAVRITLALLLVAACSEQPLPTALTPSGPRFDIADATRDYKAGFYLLPPMVKQPAYSGIFDGELSPTVEICELVAGACGALIATYTTSTGPGGEVVRLDADEQHYHVNWHTNEFDLGTTKHYRVSVRAGIYHTLLGYADVQPASSGSALKNVDTDEYIGLVDGRTLPIKFRIETGIVGNVEVVPLEATTSPGSTQQFAATVTDLHGELLNAAVVWASSDESVATVDQAGLATAIEDGVATITATSERVRGSATLTVEGNVIIVTGGNAHKCALAANGRAYCWGRNANGQLGNGSTTDRVTPFPVSGNLTFTAIDAGDQHTCAVTTVGKAYCWGTASFGKLGNGLTSPTQLSPVAVRPTLFGLDVTFVAITAGGDHTCGIAIDRQAYCWGASGAGQLGDPARHLRFQPAPVGGGHSFASISAGGLHTCGVTTAGDGYCWGNGTNGELGTGSMVNQFVPAAVSGGHKFSSIEAGQRHTCGLTIAGEVYCWGFGESGRLGNGSTAHQHTPVAVATTLRFGSISLGANYSCALTTAGEAYCWGLGQLGRLGNGSTADRLTPTAVAGGLTFVSIGAGFNSACGITATGEAYCWGSGNSHQLGNGSTANQLTPVAVAPLPPG